MAISIHIVTYNSASTIQTCLASIQAQTFSDIQVLVWDNASTDDTRELVRQHSITLLESRENVGYAVAHNRLIDQTESSYILTLNPDVHLAPKFLSEVYHALEADVRIGSAAGCLLRVENLGDAPSVIDSAGLTLRRNRRQQLLGEMVAHQTYTPSSPFIFGPDGAAAFYRRAMLDDIRLMGEVFDSDFFMHKEDVDVCWRAQLRGWTSLYVPTATAKHIRSFRPGQRGRVSEHMRCLGTRNRYLLMLKNESAAHFLRDLPFILLYDLGILAYLLLRERSSLKAYQSLWTLRGQMLEKRRIIQSGRRAEWRALTRWFRT